MADYHVDWGWWEYMYDYFQAIFKDVFDAALDTKQLYFDTDRNRKIEYCTTLRPTAESLAKATNYGEEVRKLAERLSGFLALWELAGYGLWVYIDDGKLHDITPDSIYDEDEATFIESMSPDIEEWVNDLSEYMLSTLEAEYEYLSELEDEEEEEENNEP